MGATAAGPHPGPRPLPVRGRDPPAGSVIALNGRNAAAAAARRPGRARPPRRLGSRSWRRSARERILEAACDLIAAEGIDDVRIARVAMRAGASTALVHHYFATREQLLEQALLHSFEVVGEERFAEGAGEGGSATANLAAGDRGVPAAVGAVRTRLGPLGRAVAARRPRSRAAAVRRAALRPLPRLALRRDPRPGCGSGEFERPADLDELVDRAMALLDGTGRAGAAARPRDGPRRGRAVWPPSCWAGSWGSTRGSWLRPASSRANLNSGSGNTGRRKERARVLGHRSITFAVRRYLRQLRR